MRRRDAEADVTSYTITFASSGSPLTRTLDLCTLMRGMKRQIAAPTAAAVETRVERPVASCGACGDTVAVSSLSSHIVKKHGAIVDVPPQCPDCGGTYERAYMLKHRRVEHGYDHAAALLASLAASPKRRRSR